MIIFPGFPSTSSSILFLLLPLTQAIAPSIYYSQSMRSFYFIACILGKDELTKEYQRHYVSKKSRVKVEVYFFFLNLGKSFPFSSAVPEIPRMS